MQMGRLNLREPTERKRLASEWLDYAESGNKDLFWAYDLLSDLIDEDAGLAWEIILDLLHRAPTESTFGLAAAGPLEDLVAWHGREVIDLIEHRARRDELLRRALSALWVGRDTLDLETLERFWNLGVQRIG
jgi:hypothetical protein